MPEVVELRVHGVGGSPPEGLLGVQSPEDCIQVAGEGDTSFIARRADPHVQGYVWGALTEKPLLQPFWLLLLPFTLLNVAGWMHRPVDELRGGWTGWLRIFRMLIGLVGALFTVSFFIWLSNVVINRLYNGQTFVHLAFEPRIRVLLGAAVVTLLLGAVFVLAGWRQMKFEGFTPPVAVRRRERGSSIGPAGPAATPASGGTPSRPATPIRDSSLAEPRFWNRPAYARALLFGHALAGVLAVAGVTAWSWVHSSPLDPLKPKHGLRALQIAGLATYTTEVALWAIVALTVVHLIGWGPRPAGARRFRWLGPTTAATTGVAYGTMFVYALPLLFGAHSSGRVAVLATAIGIATLALLASGAGLFGWFLVRKRTELRRARSNHAPYAVPANPPSSSGGAELMGATAAAYRKIAGSRALSEAGAIGTTALTISGLAFLLSALYQFRLGELHWLAWSVRVGEVVAVGGIGGVLVFLVRNARKPNERRIVGIVWDVLTFWPRRFHPFGVRPYAERAVPEIEARLVELVLVEGRRVILSCHSQGTVLGYSALEQLPDEVVREVAFVTYGAPLRQLYEMAFPAFFSRAGFEALRERLFRDELSPPASWRGFYRLTDYIGKTVFEDPAFEEMVPDPAVEPATAGAPLGRPFGVSFPDTPRTVWAGLLLHSYYNREVQLKAWLRELRTRMAGGGAQRDHPP